MSDRKRGQSRIVVRPVDGGYAVEDTVEKKVLSQHAFKVAAERAAKRERRKLGKKTKKR